MVRARENIYPFSSIAVIVIHVNKLCIFVGTFVVSTIFWYLGEWIGLEFFGCFMLSGLGSIIGVWAGWKVAQRLG